MFERIKRLFGVKKEEPVDPDPDGKLAEAWDEQKSKLMETILGREHDMVMHAMIPYAIGGGLDLYYYPHGVPGTAIATKELSELPGQGSANEVFSCYEIAMFTRHALNLDDTKDEKTPFGRAHATMNSVLNLIARYSAQAALNPGETCEFPAEMEHVGGKCLIFDAYGHAPETTVRGFGILAIIEVHRSEMDYARANTGADLLAKLKAAGHYPYLDLDRPAVA